MRQRMLLLLVILTVGWSGSPLYAQQEPQMTSFMFTKLLFNPAYAGSFEGGSITALHRSQWVGIEGAPTTQVLSFHMPVLYERVGIGANLVHHSIGISERWTFDGVYAYRIRTPQGATFSLGLQASIRYIGMDFQDDRLRATQGLTVDESIPVESENLYLPNFGFGLYFENEHFFVGLALPRLINSRLDFGDQISEQGEAEEVRHAFLMAGGLLPLSESLDLQPQALLKYAENAPFDADCNLSLIYQKKHAFGLSYRLGGSTRRGFGESIGLILSVQAGDRWTLGAAHDLPMSELRDQTSGSFEGFLRFAINPPQGEKVLSPRYF